MPLATRESFEAVNEKILAGLDKASQFGVGRGYLEATAGVKSGAGAFGRLEVGARPLENLSLFGYGQISAPLPGTPPGWGPQGEAGFGGRLTW